MNLESYRSWLDVACCTSFVPLQVHHVCMIYMASAHCHPTCQSKLGEHGRLLELMVSGSEESVKERCHVVRWVDQVVGTGVSRSGVEPAKTAGEFLVPDKTICCHLHPHMPSRSR